MPKSRPAIPLVEAMRLRLARMSVGPSTARSQGGAGIVAVLREGLSEVALPSLCTGTEAGFKRALDRETLRLFGRLPKGTGSWGLARKCLNIYLRDCLYDRGVNAKFHFERCEAYLELPLDSLVGKALRSRFGDAVPAWATLKNLTPEGSGDYQAAAGALADLWGMARVHLDLYLWLGLETE